jgi:hypothetical protein
MLRTKGNGFGYGGQSIYANLLSALGLAAKSRVSFRAGLTEGL